MNEAPTLAPEVANTLEVLRGRCGVPDTFGYFTDLAERYFSGSGAETPGEVLIAGSSFPEELLWASGMRPHWVIGGGLSVGASIDDRVPRDADAVSRSVFGYIEDYLARRDPGTPVIVPISGDNPRKIAYLLSEEGRNVLTIDITPEIEQSRLYDSLRSQLHGIMAELTCTWNMPGAGRRLRQWSRTVFQAKSAARALTDPALNMSGMVKMFLLNTYFYADDVTRWRQSLSELIRQWKSDQTEAPKPGVVIVGSPVLFPNYKVPMLLESAGLSIRATCDYVSGKVLSAAGETQKGNRELVLQGLVQQTYGSDCSGAFVSNRAIYDRTAYLLDTLDVQGVIFHVIKGQIEYDFELERMESLFAAHELPVFRLETDYHDNDVEQLRIRLEAFAELLMQDV